MTLNILILSAMTVWCIISLKLGATKNMELEEVRRQVYSMDVQNPNYQKEKAKLQVQTDVLLKILQNYLQIVGAIASFDLPIPQAIQTAPHATGEPIKQQLYSMDCVLIQIKTSVPFIYFRFLVGLSLPVLYIAVYFLAAILFDIIKRKKIQFTIILSALLYYFIFLQPDIVHQILSILSCRKVAGKDYIIADMTQLCYTSTFYQYGFSILIPLLLFFMILAPAFLYWVLKRNYYKLLDFKVRHQYGFLYKEYR